MNRNIVWVIVVLVVIAVVALKLGKKESEVDIPDTSQKSSAIDATVGTWKTQQTITPYFYEQFLPAGSEVSVKPFTNPGDQKTALLAGSLDMTGTTMVQAIISASKNEPVVLVCALSNKCSALVVGKDSDIADTADLKGKRIGYVPNTMHHILLLEALSKANLNASDVKLVRVDFFDMKTALGAKQIDAFLSGEPYPTIAVADGVGRILSYPYLESIGTINSGMLVTKEMIEKNPQKVQALVTAHVKATKYLQENPEAWIDASAKFGTQADMLKIAAKNIDMNFRMDQAFITNMENLAARMKELGMIDEIPNINDLVNTRFLEVAEKEVASK